jgi:hypothetical protein
MFKCLISAMLRKQMRRVKKKRSADDFTKANIRQIIYRRCLSGKIHDVEL